MVMSSAVVWAGSDLYKLVSFPATLQGNNAAIEAEVRHQILPEMMSDFGEGTELTPDPEPQVFHINVDKVKKEV